MKKIGNNPILTGFHPDPSAVRVGDTYYVANSTFEWFPGVRIYESKDLCSWKFIASPLDRVSQLDLRGVESSGGIWAPDLSYCDGTYYLIYTIVRNQGRIKDTHNYMVTSSSIEGPWSEPIYLNSSGFDPSLFHDKDGRKWLLNMIWDYRKEPGPEAFFGIVLQEYDIKKKSLVGKPIKIYDGTSLKYTEGPHLYRHGEYYYLMCAEGGTSYGHAVTMARSKFLMGPYETDPENPMLTSKDEDILQKAGHASLVDTPDGEWYLFHLCARPLPETKRCVLGRETAIQQVYWNEQGWLRLRGGGNRPAEQFQIEIPVGIEKEIKEEKTEKYYTFKNEDFLRDFQTLRIPFKKIGASLSARSGWIRLKGGDGITSRFAQALVARRQTDVSFFAMTKMEFKPESFQHSAGLIYRYNEENQYYLFVTFDEENQVPLLCAVSVYEGKYQIIYEKMIHSSPYILGIAVKETKGRFFYELEKKRIFFGDEFDVTNLSDDFTEGFTGAFVGICAQDLQDHKKSADFQWFLYQKM